MLGHREKDPNATLDYAIDWSTWLDTDTIAATSSGSTWILSSTEITATTESNTTTTATVWLSGGKANQVYTITNRIVTTAGRTQDDSFTLTVVEQ